MNWASVAAAALWALSGVVQAAGGLVWRNSSTGENYIHQLDQRGIIREQAIGDLVAEPWQMSLSGDFDGNGETDLFWRQAVSGDNAIQLLKNGQHLAYLDVNPVADLDWQVIAAADFDADRTDDLLWRNKTTGELWLYLIKNGQVVGQGPIGINAPPEWSPRFVQDYDGDGRADLLWRNSLTGETYLLFMNANQIVSEAEGPQVAQLDWQLVASADLNRDGKADLVWRNTLTGENYLFRMNAAQVLFEYALPTVTDLDWSPSLIADLDADGNNDVVWRNQTTGEVASFMFDAAGAVRNIADITRVADPNWQLKFWVKTLSVPERYREQGSNHEYIYDQLTGLEWQRCSWGQSWNDSAKTCTGAANAYTWSAAMALTLPTGWRLPSLTELRSLVFCSSGTPVLIGMDRDGSLCTGSYVRPTIVADFFPATPSAAFWSSSKSASDNNSAGSVHFAFGLVRYDLLTEARSLRLVREAR